ncbi:ferritin [Solitalea sp. MAHUQ-68]|uniref:Ferritin n=1 Tax=Solitalea agri TaxID=2953739 RepID=A0A9X2JDL8_9SPHI|nr:ferritin [Solitalea agri]MCO4294607.1 ferritin [Solitalea agri]
MISKNMENMLNEQINAELFSANLYLSICSYFQDQELDGFANFFRVQSKEELFHAGKQFDYIHAVGGKVTMKGVGAPETDFKSIIHAFEVTLAHEKKVTASINGLVKQALTENDYATHNFLQWFIAEQVEEEASISNLLKKLQMIGDNSSALYLLNTELGQRTFVEPTIK